MATMMQARVRPASTADYRSPSRPRSIGLVLSVAGLMLALVTLIVNLTVSTDSAATTLPWSFGLTTTAFGTIKVAIAVVLWGIVMKLWVRADSIGTTLAKVSPQEPGSASGDYDSPFRAATSGDSVPDDLPIHKMAKKMFGPMLVMGAIAVTIGLFVSFAWADTGSVSSAAWTQGLQFLDEDLLLSGISFLLGTILWAIRTAGAEVHSGLGVRVKTLKMPTTAKLFVVLMMLGLMISMLQFVLYLLVAGGVANPAAWFAFLGPFREFGLAMILSGIALALVSIGTALDFQFERVVELFRARAQKGS